MQSTFLFAFRSIAPFLVLCYVLGMLAVPCLPMTDAMEQPIAVSRLEFWLIHVSVPSAIWWRWTDGFQPIWFTDRLPVFVLASAWVITCWILGRLTLRCDPINTRLSATKRNCLALFIGHSWLALIVFLHGTFLGPQATLSLLLFISIVSATLWCIGNTLSAASNLDPSLKTSQTQKSSGVPDTSFETSIRRRMIGVLFLAIAWLSVVQFYGATVPTSDQELRNGNWWLANHALQDGQLHYRHDNLESNEPAGWTMPSLACVSILDSWSAGESESNENWKEKRLERRGRLRLGVVSGKLIQAIMCVAAIFLLGVHLSERWGVLPSLFVTFLLIATPGIAELTRFGRTECLAGAWAIAMLCIWQTIRSESRHGRPLGIAWWMLFAGAFCSGYGTALLIGLPAIGLAVWNRFAWRRHMQQFAQPNWEATPMPLLAFRSLIVVAILAAGTYFIRNGLAVGDPIAPWSTIISQQIGRSPSTEFGRNWSNSHRVRSETILEASSENNVLHEQSVLNSPYRIANFLDGLSRLLWHSNVHGLMLVPFAVLGLTVSLTMPSYRIFGLSMVGYAFWVCLWWWFSPRFDRDWVGALFLLGWPAVSGVSWMMNQANRYWLALLVTIGISWSVVVIPIWPTSDSRLLVSMDSIQSPESVDSMESIPTDYVAVLNRMLLKDQHLNRRSKLLLVGDNDDFDLLCPCITNGPFDRSVLDDCVDVGPKDRLAALRLKGITHVVIVWSGIRERERDFPVKSEIKIRNLTNEMLSSSRLQAIPWDINSSQAELFRVSAK